MTDGDGYALLDAGDGRRLEQFGDRIVDRPAPAAADRRRRPAAWREASLRFERATGWAGDDLAPWTISMDGLTLELRPTDAGQLGLFPEHATFWPWFHDRLWNRPGAEVLHLFAGTGPTTLALAREGARVTHVDASRPAVAWARRNADLSALSDRPIRWLVDDAEAFVRRETRRGRRYDGVVLDPPTYGHGARGCRWRLEERLGPLLDTVALLQPRVVLLTAHSTGWHADQLVEAMHDVFAASEIGAGDLELAARSGALLHLGVYASAIIDR